MAHAEALREGIGPRGVGGPGESQAARYVFQYLESLGLDVRTEPVRQVPAGSPDGYVRLSGTNVLADLGSGEGGILLAAHHDGPATGGSGAAVGVLLEVARVLAAEPPEGPVRLASFTAGEVGNLGLRAYVGGHRPGSGRNVLLEGPLCGELRVGGLPAGSRWGTAWLLAEARRLGLGRVRAAISWIEGPPGSGAGLEDGTSWITLRGDPAAAPCPDPETAREAAALLVGLVRSLDGGAIPEARGEGTHAVLRLPLAGSRVVGPLGIAALFLLQPFLLAGLLTRHRRREPGPRPVLRALAGSACVTTLLWVGLGATELTLRGLTGWERPAAAHPGLHVAVLVIGGALGWTLGQGLAARWRLPKDRGIWEGIGAFGLVVPAVALAVVGRAELGFLLLLPATAILVSIYFDGFLLRGLLVGVGCLPLGSLAPRLLAARDGDWSAAGVLWLVTLPLAGYALGWWRQRSRGPRRGRTTLAAAALAVLWGLGLAWAGWQPGYDARHPRTVRVEEVIHGDGTARVTFRSEEPLRGLAVGLPGWEGVDASSREAVLTVAATVPPPGCLAAPEGEGWTRIVLLPVGDDPVGLEVTAPGPDLAWPEAPDAPRRRLEWASRDGQGEFSFLAAQGGRESGELRFRFPDGLLDIPLAGEGVVFDVRSTLLHSLADPAVCGSGAEG
ncbi:MAG: M28 family peptidase [Acidobacteriota bacterium]